MPEKQHRPQEGNHREAAWAADIGGRSRCVKSEIAEKFTFLVRRLQRVAKATMPGTTREIRGKNTSPAFKGASGDAVRSDRARSAVRDAPATCRRAQYSSLHRSQVRTAPGPADAQESRPGPRCPMSRTMFRCDWRPARNSSRLV